MMCSEWWEFQILTLLAGTLGVQALCGQIIVVNVSATLFMVALGIQEAAGAIVGNCIGANDV
jgi:multidrug resistance protein, MATE family